MPNWKKVVVSGSNVSQLVNDGVYLRTIGDGIISSSAQLSTQISGAFTATSAAFDGRINSISSSTSTFAGTGSNSFKGDQTFSGSLLPETSETFDLGSPSQVWDSLYVNGQSIYMKDTATGQFVTMSAANGVLTFNNTKISAPLGFLGDIVSSSQQIKNYNVFATTGSNTFIGGQSITGSLSANGGITGSFKGNLDGVAAYSSLVAVSSVGTTTDTTLYPTFTLNPILGSYTGLYSHLSGSFFLNGVTRRVHMEGFVVSGSNNTAEISGSLNISGSTYQIGNNTLVGNTTLSGSIIISGSSNPTTPTVKIYGDFQTDGVLKFTPVNKSIDTSVSASYIYVSGSTNDLYFSQNGEGYSNTTRLRWLEGNLYTGLLNGGVITSQSSTTYQISSGNGIIVSLNASLNNEPFPTIQYVSWPNLTGNIGAFTASYQQAFVGIDTNANIYAQGTPFSNGQFDSIINIGNVLFQNQSTINGVKTQPSVAYGFEQSQNTFNRAFGPLKLSGYTLSPTQSLGLTVGSGTAYSPGSNYVIDPNEPYYTTDSGTNTSKIFRYYQSGSSWGYLTNAGAGYTTIDPANYSNNGILTTVQPNDWSIQRVFWFPNSVTKAIVVYYGNQSYSTEAEAIANINIESFVEAPNTAANGIYLGAIIIRGGGVFTAPADFTIVPGGLFRQVGGSGGGGSVVTQTLSGLSDVNVSGPTNYQALVYNTTQQKWINASSISASITGNAATATSASYATTSSYTLSGLQQITDNGSTTTNGITIGGLTVNGDAVITGTLTAQQFNTEFVSSSIIFESGSTKFGDSVDDIHSFTGSVKLNTETAATTDTDKFLVFDTGGQIKYRTGAEVLSDINPGGLVSSSAQLTTEFDTRYLNTIGDNVISSSAQLTTEFDTRYLNTIGDNVISSSAQVTISSTTGYTSFSSSIASDIAALQGAGYVDIGTGASSSRLAIWQDGDTIKGDTNAIFYENYNPYGQVFNVWDDTNQDGIQTKTISTDGLFVGGIGTDFTASITIASNTGPTSFYTETKLGSFNFASAPTNAPIHISAGYSWWINYWVSGYQGYRTGMIMITSNAGNNAVHSEVSTGDIGNTSDIEFSVGISGGVVTLYVTAAGATEGTLEVKRMYSI